ncbi:hypothetical protein D3C85_1673200 [compost metagenome]
MILLQPDAIRFLFQLTANMSYVIRNAKRQLSPDLSGWKPGYACKHPEHWTKGLFIETLESF